MRRLAPVLAPLLALVLGVSPVAAATPGTWSAVPSDPLVFGAPGVATLGARTAPDGRLYVWGYFHDLGGDPTADWIAAWDPESETWSGLGSDGAGDGAIEDVVWDVTFAAGEVLVAGSFVDAAGDPGADYLAAYDPATHTWSQIGGPSALDASVRSVAARDGKIWVGGSFHAAGGDPGADWVAVWDGTGWDAIDGAVTPSLDDSVMRVVPLADGRVCVGGRFGAVRGDTRGAKVACWDPSAGAWALLREAGASGPAFALSYSDVDDIEAIGSDLYVAGYFEDAAGIAGADGIARWDGAAWHALDSLPADPTAGHVLGYVWALDRYGETLIASGQFAVAGGPSMVAAWTGSRWLSLGDPAFGSPWEGTYGSVSGTTYTMTGLFDSVAGLAGTSGLARFELPAGPAAPTRLAVRPAGRGAVTLAWAAPANDGGSPLTDYAIEYRAEGASDRTLVPDGVGTATRFALRGLPGGKSYAFRVTPRNEWATGESATVALRRVP